MVRRRRQQYADSLDDPGNVKVVPEALDRRDADGGRAHPRRQGRAGPAPRSRTAPPRWRAARAPATRAAAVQPRPVPHGLWRRRRRQGRAHDLRLRTPRSRPSARATTAAWRSRSATPTPRSSRCSASPTAAATRCTTPPGTPDEQPGASPEIFPSPDFDAAGLRDANVERCTRCRSMVMQAWNQYGTMWPVVHQQLGVRPGPRPRPPDGGAAAAVVGRRSPARTSGSATAALDQVNVWRDGRRYGTSVKASHVPADRLVIGQTLPRGASIRSVTLDGRRHGWHARTTNRGLEVTVATRPGRHEVVITPASRGRPRSSGGPTARRPSRPARGWRAPPARPRRRGRPSTARERGRAGRAHPAPRCGRARPRRSGRRARSPPQPEPRVERPHRTAVVGVRLEYR